MGSSAHAYPLGNWPPNKAKGQIGGGDWQAKGGRANYPPPPSLTTTKVTSDQGSDQIVRFGLVAVVQQAGNFFLTKI